MIRVLLATDADADYDGRAIAEQVKSTAGTGLYCIHAALTPGGATPQAMRRLSRLDREHEFDILHAVGPASLLSLLPVGCQPIVYTPPADEPARGLKRLRWVSRVRKVIVACGSAAAKRELDDRFGQTLSTRIVTPPILTDATSAISRAELGLKDEHKLVLAIGESSRRTNHRLSAWAAVILYIFDRRYRFLIWGRGPMADAMREYTRLLRQPGFCVFAEDAARRELQWPQIAAAADVALFSADRPVGLHAARVSQALGVPIVATPSEIARELDPASCEISWGPRARALAATVHRLAQNGRIGRRAPQETGDADLSMWLQLYENAIVGRDRQFVTDRELVHC